MIGRHIDRRDVIFHARGLMNSVVARAGSFGSSLSDDLGHLFETTTVIRHESDAPITRMVVTSQNADLFHLGMGEKVAEAGHLRWYDDGGGSWH